MTATPGTTQTVSVTFLAAPGGPPVDVTGATLTIRRGAVTVYGPRTDLVRVSAGVYRHDWPVPAAAEPGAYTLTWSGTLPGQSGPSVGQEVIQVDVPQVEVSEQCWPVDTTAVPDWSATEPADDTDDAEEVPVYTEAQKALAVAYAVQTLTMLTGGSVGGCPITVRPCVRSARNLTWLGRTGPSWRPVDVGGSWVNIACGHPGGCGCIHAREVTIPGAREVTAVRVDGVLLDPTAYRTDPGGRLVRTDGAAWPLRQRLDRPDTDFDTWAVTYRPGAAVDAMGAYAAGVLAGEFLAAINGRECRLPTGVTQIVRPGITLQITPGAFPDGRTGLREVDAYVQRHNPGGLRSPSTVWSPDTARNRVVR